MMKAAVINEFGSADVLKVEDVATPSPKPGHVLIKVLAAGVNRLDHYLREGSVVPEFPFPHVLGIDGAGEIAKLGANVEGFEIGERVIAVPGFPLDENEYDIYPASLAPSFTMLGLGVWGTYAQYVEVPAVYVIKDETGLSVDEAATLPIVLGTAVRAVKEIGQVKAGDKVLIQAGASGSGSMHIQVAKALGATVIATIRNESKAALVKSVGADKVINSQNVDVIDEVMQWTNGTGVDVAIDNLGGDVLAQSIDCVKANGVIVAYGFSAGTKVTFDIRNFFFGQKQLRGSMACDKKDFEWGLEQVKQKIIRPVLDISLPLCDAAEAHRLIANNEVAGNIVLRPWAE
jgi:NADPH:quinone reductase-like Zn-dependent oxidoreductase